MKSIKDKKIEIVVSSSLADWQFLCLDLLEQSNHKFSCGLYNKLNQFEEFKGNNKLSSLAMSFMKQQSSPKPNDATFDEFNFLTRTDILDIIKKTYSLEEVIISRTDPSNDFFPLQPIVRPIRK